MVTHLLSAHSRRSATAPQYRYTESIQNPDEFWANEARKRLVWRRDFDQTSNINLDNASIQWFPGGQVSCVT